MFVTKCIKSGQAGPRKDSVWQYEIESDLPATEVLLQCTLNLGRGVNPANRCNQMSQHNGSCEYPFGLDSFYAIIETADGRWMFSMVQPYTD
jgi:hypothetical protein